MPKTVRLSKLAIQDINKIMENIVEYTGAISTATKFYEELSEHFDTLGVIPKMGQLQEDGSRHTFCRHYRIVHEERYNEVMILAVLHSRRKYPSNR